MKFKVKVVDVLLFDLIKLLSDDNLKLILGVMLIDLNNLDGLKWIEVLINVVKV